MTPTSRSIHGGAGSEAQGDHLEWTVAALLDDVCVMATSYGALASVSNRIATELTFRSSRVATLDLALSTYIPAPLKENELRELDSQDPGWVEWFRRVGDYLVTELSIQPCVQSPRYTRNVRGGAVMD